MGRACSLVVEASCTDSVRVRTADCVSWVASDAHRACSVRYRHGLYSSLFEASECATSHKVADGCGDDNASKA